MVDISIIIVSYNTKETTKRCLETLFQTIDKNKNVTFEVIIVDNNSTDGSVEELRSNKKIILLALRKNVGFGKANNIGLRKAKGTFILYLNSDIIHTHRVDYHKLITHLNNNKKIGALTVKVILPTDEVDPASHRGFPTVWRSFAYFSKLEHFTKNIPLLNRIFGGYHLSHLSLDTVHNIDSPSGAYYLSPSKVQKTINGFDEDFFMYGEDLDMSYRIKQLGYSIIYYPHYIVTHLKYQSGIKAKNDVIRKEIKRHFYKSMQIFYNKHYKQESSFVFHKAVNFLLSFIIRSIS